MKERHNNVEFTAEQFMEAMNNIKDKIAAEKNNN